MKLNLKAKGFTLIELIIVVLILGILLAIATPSYQKYLISFHRGEAKAILMQAQLNQEEFQMFNQRYTNRWKDLNIPPFNKYYDFSIISADERTYGLKAKVKATTTQIKDQKLCHILTVDQNSNHTNNICWGK